MELNSKFANALKGGLKLVAIGIKASNDSFPTLSLLGIQNKFQLNKLATQALNVEIGDRVRIIAAAKADDINTKYYIAKTSADDSTGAKLSKANSGSAATKDVDMTFNYSGVWGICLQGDANASELGMEALAAAGLVFTSETSGGNPKHRAMLNVKFTLVAIGPVEIEGATYDVWAITDRVQSSKTEEELKATLVMKPRKDKNAPIVQTVNTTEEEEIDLNDEEEEDED